MDSGKSLSERVLFAAQQGVEQAALALGRVFGGEWQLSPPGEIKRWSPALWSGSRSGLQFHVANSVAWAAIALPASDSFLSNWRQLDDAKSLQLRGLAGELGRLLLPGEFHSFDGGAVWTEDLVHSLSGRISAQPAQVVEAPYSCGNVSGTMAVVWAMNSAPPSNATPASDGQFPTSATSPSTPAPATRPTEDRVAYERIEEAIPYLPVYSRSLLKIKVPVRVTLAATQLPVRQIIELAPGTLIQFAKSCEESLELEVGRHPVARGEAVKVGEKFGLRITHMALPGERFYSIGKQGRSGW